MILHIHIVNDTKNSKMSSFVFLFLRVNNQYKFHLHLVIVSRKYVICIYLCVLCKFTLCFDPITHSTGPFIDFKLIPQNKFSYLFHSHFCFNPPFKIIFKHEEYIGKNEYSQVNADNDYNGML